MFISLLTTPPRLIVIELWVLICNVSFKFGRPMDVPTRFGTGIWFRLRGTCWTCLCTRWFWACCIVTITSYSVYMLVLNGRYWLCYFSPRYQLQNTLVEGTLSELLLKICPGRVEGFPKTSSPLVHFKSSFTVLRSASMTKGRLSTQVRPFVDAVSAYFNCLWNLSISPLLHGW